MDSRYWRRDPRAAIEVSLNLGGSNLDAVTIVHGVIPRGDAPDCNAVTPWKQRASEREPAGSRRSLCYV